MLSAAVPRQGPPTRGRCPKCGLRLARGTLMCPRDGAMLVESVEPPLPLGAPLAVPQSPSDWERTVVRDLMVGRKLGDYTVTRRVGSGGMGIVYEGVQQEIGRKVAIKVLRPEYGQDPLLVRGLLREARAAIAARHRGIVDVFTFGHLEGVGQYLVMEFLDGLPLDQHVQKRGPLALGQTFEVLDQVLSALGAAHAVGVVHGDLKPSNIFLVEQPSSEGPVVKLLDFGIARQAANPGAAVAQTSLVSVGTPEFMPPEQIMGEPLDGRSDLYAAGCVAFELFTGVRAFTGRTPGEIVVKQVNQPPPRLTQLRPGLDVELEALVRSMMAKRAADRPASAQDVRGALRALRDRVCHDAPATVVGTARRTPAPTRVAPSSRPVVVTPTVVDAVARVAAAELPEVTDAAAPVLPAGPSPVELAPVRRRSSPLLLVLAGACFFLLGLGLVFVVWPTPEPAVRELPVPAELVLRPPPTPPEPVAAEVAAPTTAAGPLAVAAVERQGAASPRSAPRPHPSVPSRPPPAVDAVRLPGTLKVVVHGGRARVLVDDAPVKDARLGVELPAGGHRLALELEAAEVPAQRWSGAVSVAAGVTRALEFDLVQRESDQVYEFQERR